MNTSNLKRFAQSARRKLMDQVAAKMEHVLTTDSAELREKTKQINELKKELNHTTREQLVERIAYTWFNRLAALRFMDANDYQPSGIRVVSPAEDTILPQVLYEAKQGNIPADWKVNVQKVYGLLDGRLPASNPQNEAYRELLIAACNHLHSVFPFLFEAIDDFTELLLPDDLTSDFSIIQDVETGMPAEDCQQVEVLGWLYQFYISEKKDEVFASKSKVKKEDIPAATQLFTPRWIVEYMVQNTVGKLWLQNRPNSKLRDHMQYYIESAEGTHEEGRQDDGDHLKINYPEEITLLDQASGSGHILVYGFDLFYLIYEEEGYSPSEIPALILENNLFGFEIDPRAAQLAGFALLMKAREYHRRIFKKGIQPNILTFTDLAFNDRVRQFVTIDLKVSENLISDLKTMQQATNFGSLIQPKALPEEIDEVLHKVNNELKTAGLFNKESLEQLRIALEQLQLLGKKFCCVADNPPYMGGGAMNKELSEFVKRNFPNSKADLMACFMEAGLQVLESKGFLGMINQQSWMFLDYFKSLRKNILSSYQIDSLLLLGPRTFEEISGEVVQNTAFTIINTQPISKGVYYKLDEYNSSEEKRLAFKIITPYKSMQLRYNSILDSPIGFWFSDKQIEIFESFNSLADYSDVRAGLQTGDNYRFIREWHEIQKREMSTNYKQNPPFSVDEKWFIYNKGGSFRKWYGNKNLVVDWQENGKNIKNDKLKKLSAGLIFSSNSKPKNTKYYFKSGLTWSTTGGKAPSFRIMNDGELFDIKGSCVFPHKSGDKLYLLSLLNSIITTKNLKVLSPNLDSNPGYVAKLPLSMDQYIKPKVEKICTDSIEISMLEYNSKEHSINFQQNELIRLKKHELEETYFFYKEFWQRKFIQLHVNEEELNRQFIELYGLQEELTPVVLLEDITILQQELDRKALIKLNKRLKREPGTLKVLNHNEIELPFIAKEVITQFVSYSVGCMFGRYSLAKPGLILANQGETLEDYFEKLKDKTVYAGTEEPLLAAEPGKAGLGQESFNPFANTSSNNMETHSFIPDDDNVIPVLDDEWFEDDIVGRFKEFLKASFGEQHFDRNLQFVEECLGKDIRRYFARDFYADHVRRYKKRPIYWMFSSPGGSFNALIYMHRYTPDTISLMLNNYLRTYQDKLRARRQHLEQVQISGSVTEKAPALKENERIAKVLMELHEYEHDVLYPLATQRINIDLDDGVLVNYNKFGKAVKTIAGLNDAPTKKKVRGFDWIDTTKII